MRVLDPMAVATMVVAAACLLAIASYAQYRIAFHTAAPRVAPLRVTLAVVGIAVGYVSALTSGASGGLALLAFLTGFGVVHVPAALILLFKQLRHEGRS